MSDKTQNPQPRTDAVQTTGHAWDGDLQEYNNPLPRWWLWCFYGTAVFTILYWLVYPSWPVGDTWIKGFGTVTYTVTDRATGAEEERTDRWNTRYLLVEEMNRAANDPRRREMLAQVQQADYDQIVADPRMMEFVRSVGRGLFGDNCAGCHGRGGEGVFGLYPNLADDDWLWGGGMEQIHETLVRGRNGFMPAFGQVLTPTQLDEVAEYVLTLSGEAPPSEASARGQEIFQGRIGGCYHCHGMDGTGIPSQGAPNLTNKIWNIVAVPGQDTLQGKKAAVGAFVARGVNNVRVMPGWKDRLSPVDVKLLAVYVRQLGGGAQ